MFVFGAISTFSNGRHMEGISCILVLIACILGGVALFVDRVKPAYLNNFATAGTLFGVTGLLSLVPQTTLPIMWRFNYFVTMAVNFINTTMWIVDLVVASEMNATEMLSSVAYGCAIGQTVVLTLNTFLCVYVLLGFRDTVTKRSDDASGMAKV